MNRTRFLFCCLTLALLVPGARPAEGQTPSTSAVPATFLQGESKQIPADFFAELEQSRLRLKLQDFGLRDAREGLDQALVTLITPSGPPQRAPSDAQGNVVFDNVAEGPLGLVVTGPGLHASAAVFATEAAPEENAVAQSGGSPFSLPVMRIDPLEVLKNTSAYAPVNVQDDFTPTEYAGFSHYEAVPVVYYQVLPLADGTVAGRVSTIVDPDLNLEYTDTNITIYKGGEYFRSTVTGPGGFYELPDMPPGVYGLIAAGPMGYAAFAFEVLAPGAAAPGVAAPGDLPEPDVAGNQGDKIFRTAAFAANAAPGDGVGSMLYVPLLPPAMLAELRRILLDAYGGLLGPDFAGVPPLGPPGFPPGGGFGGGPGGGFGGGAGGGGLGGGGGIGSLLGLAGLAGLAGLSGDGGDFVPPGFASPAIP